MASYTLKMLVTGSSETYGTYLPMYRGQNNPEHSDIHLYCCDGLRSIRGNSNKSTNQMQQFHKFITWRLCVAQHVSVASTPIIRSLQLHLAASGFTVVAWW